MAGLPAGSLDRLIRIERASSTDDGWHSRPGGWSKLADVYASYRPGKGSERLEMASRRAELPVAFQIRWSPKVADVGPKDRIRYPIGGQVYEIVSPAIELGRREGIELLCIAADE